MLGNVAKTREARVAQGSLLTCITEPMQFGAERKKSYAERKIKTLYANS